MAGMTTAHHAHDYGRDHAEAAFDAVLEAAHDPGLLASVGELSDDPHDLADILGNAEPAGIDDEDAVHDEDAQHRVNDWLRERVRTAVRADSTNGVAKSLGLRLRVKAFDESQHPRDSHGHFMAGDAIAEAASDPTKLAELRANVKPADAHKLEAAVAAHATTPPVATSSTASGDATAHPAVARHTDRLASAARRLPAAVRSAAVAFVKRKYEQFEGRYGPTGAKLVLAGTLLAIPIPLPGTAFAPVAIAEGVRAVAAGVRAIAGGAAKADMPELTEDELADEIAATLEEYGADVPEPAVLLAAARRALRAGGTGAASVAHKSFDESKHPRDNHGHFISAGDIDAAASDPAKAKELLDKVKPADAGKLHAAIAEAGGRAVATGDVPPPQPDVPDVNSFRRLAADVLDRNGGADDIADAIQEQHGHAISRQVATYLMSKEADGPPNEELPDSARPVLTLDEQAAVYDYTEEGYQEINQILRDGGDPPEVLERAMAKTQPFAKPVRTVRGMELEDDSLDEFVASLESAAESGETVRSPAYVSTTTGGGFPGNVQLTIHAKRGLDCQPHGKGSHGGEILLPAGSHFRVISVKRTGDRVKAELEQVLDEPAKSATTRVEKRDWTPAAGKRDATVPTGKVDRKPSADVAKPAAGRRDVKVPTGKVERDPPAAPSGKPADSKKPRGSKPASGGAFDGGGGGGDKPKGDDKKPAPSGGGGGKHDESKHPRDDHGRFVKKDDITAAAGDPEAEKKILARTRPEDRDAMKAKLAEAAAEKGKGGGGDKKPSGKRQPAKVGGAFAEGGDKKPTGKPDGGGDKKPTHREPKVTRAEIAEAAAKGPDAVAALAAQFDPKYAATIERLAKQEADKAAAKKEPEKKPDPKEEDKPKDDAADEAKEPEPEKESEATGGDSAPDTPPANDDDDDDDNIDIRTEGVDTAPLPDLNTVRTTEGGSVPPEMMASIISAAASSPDGEQAMRKFFSDSEWAKIQPHIDAAKEAAAAKISPEARARAKASVASHMEKHKHLVGEMQAAKKRQDAKQVESMALAAKATEIMLSVQADVDGLNSLSGEERTKKLADIGRRSEEAAQHLEDADRLRQEADAEVHNAIAKHVGEPAGDAVAVKVPDHMANTPRGQRAARASEFLGKVVGKAAAPDGVPPVALAEDPPPDGRAFYDAGKVHLTDANRTHVAVHEAAHHLEQTMPGVLEAAMAFVAHRTEGSPPIKMAEKYPNDGYGPHETGNPDDFGKHFKGSGADYIGKSYGGSATEVISMGMEALYKDPAGFARDDPEYFHFIMSVLDGTVAKEHAARQAKG